MAVSLYDFIQPIVSSITPDSCIPILYTTACFAFLYLIDTFAEIIWLPARIWLKGGK